jgi:hypothetical protein
VAKTSYEESPPEPCSYTVSVPTTYGAFILFGEKGYALYVDDRDVRPANLTYQKTVTFQQDGKEYVYYWYQETSSHRDWFLQAGEQAWRSVYYRDPGARRDVAFGAALFAELRLRPHSFASVIRDRASKA